VLVLRSNGGCTADNKILTINKAGAATQQSLPALPRVQESDGVLMENTSAVENL